MEFQQEFRNMEDAYKLFCFRIDSFISAMKDFKKEEILKDSKIQKAELKY